MTPAELAAMTDEEFEQWLRQRKITGLEAVAWARKRRAARAALTPTTTAEG